MVTQERDFLVEEEHFSDTERMILWKEVQDSLDEEDNEAPVRSKYF
ncbi:MAG: hypothetical protein WCG55_03745 [bacterium]